jgi:hypothetical protein
MQAGNFLETLSKWDSGNSFIPVSSSKTDDHAITAILLIWFGLHCLNVVHSFTALVRRKNLNIICRFCLDDRCL